MLARTAALIFLCGLIYADRVWCGAIELPSDISVSLTAEPSTELESGDTIMFAVSVTNLGPEPIDALVVSSSFFHDQLDVFSLTVEGCEGGPLAAAVVDYVGGAWDYFVAWYPVLPSTPPLNVGETLTCRFSMSLTDTAPASYPFSFDLGGSLVDLNPANDTATVILYRAIQDNAMPVPTLSPFVLSLLAGLLALLASIVRRPSMVKTSGGALDNKRLDVTESTMRMRRRVLFDHSP